MDEHQDEKLSPAADRPPPEEVGEFLLSLIQAFLRTGYYLPAHPESRRAKVGLFDKFHHLTGASGELTLILRGEGTAAAVSVEGLSEQPLKLKDTMLKGMAETYNPRFVHFLARKELVSLSLSARMDEEEFSRFVDLIAEPFLEEMREHATKDRFIACLEQRGISNLSFVFNEDFITEHRNLPWRAALALSRLRKDITLIPIFRHLRRDQIAQVRREVLDDILRPLNVPELIYAFLMNLDLVRMPDLTEEQAEDEVFALVKEGALLVLTPLFIRDATGKEKRYRDLLPPEKFARVLGKFFQRLNQIDSPAARGLIEEMFNAGLLSLEDLSPEIRERIMTIQLATSFLAARANYLRHLDQAPPEEYSRRAHLMAKIVPCLLERGQLEEASSITERLAGHGREESERGLLARETLNWLANGPALEMARSAFLGLAKEERVHLGELFVHLGQWAAPHLLAVIRETEDPWRRKQAAELLTRIGPEAAAALLYEVERGQISGQASVVLVRVLGHVGNGQLKPAAVRALRGKVRDRDPEVRREALLALGRLAPREEYESFAAGLRDPDPRVGKAALRGLGLSGDPAAPEIIEGIIHKAEHSGSADDWDMAAAAVEALGYHHEAGVPSRTKVEEILLELARRGCPEGTWKKLTGRAHRPPEAMLVALAEALGRVGGPAANAPLRRLAEDRDPAVARRAAEALKRCST